MQIQSKESVFIFKELYNFFQDNGFVLIEEKKQFRRQTLSGFQNVIFSTSLYDSQVILEVNLGVRIDSVEMLANQFLNNLRAFHADTHTAIASIGKIRGNLYERFKAKDEDELQDVCQQIETFMDTQGFDFLDKYSSLYELSNAYNSKLIDPCPVVYNTVHRVFKGTIIAKIVQEKNFEKLIADYTMMLEKQGSPDSVMSDYQRLIVYLQFFSMN